MRSSRNTLSAFAALLSVLAVSAVFAEAESEFLTARDTLAAKSYEQAATLLGKIRDQYPGSEFASEATILRARALELGGKRDDAVQSLVEYLGTNPKDPWITRARLLLAELYFAKRDFKSASDVYIERLEFLSGDSYLEKLTAHYLMLADPAFEGRKVQDPNSVLPKEIVQHDYATALEYYRKARAIYLPAGRQGEINFRVARSLLELSKPAESVAELRYLLGRVKSDIAPPQLERTLRGEAIFSLATGLYRSGNPAGAIAEFLELEKTLGDHPWVPLALERVGRIRLEIAGRSSVDSERRARFAEALKAWDRFLERFPQHANAPSVAFARAEAIASYGNIDAAISAFEAYPTKFPKDPKSPDAILRVATLHRSRDAFDAAEAAWKKFLGTYPNDQRWSNIQQAIIRAQYDKGAHLRAQKKNEEARTVWTQFLREHPLDALAPEVYRRFYEMALPQGAPAPANGKIETDDARRKALTDAIAHLRTLFGKYPRSSLAPSSRLLTAQTLHHRLDLLEEAITEYESLVVQYGRHPEAHQARSALSALRRKHLKVTTPRSFTTEGAWRVEIESRNISRLRFKAYRLNLEEYFRRKNFVAAVENVVVGVVEPTKTWEANIDEFRPFRLQKGLRELPLEAKEVGAYILTVEDIPPEGGAGAEELAQVSGGPLLATTLLVRSNLAFVTKHAASGTLVWVFDERTGIPVKGARVLLSTGSGVAAEGKTDDEGVWVHDRSRSSNLSDVRVMAIAAPGEGLEGNSYAVDRSIAHGVASYGYTTKAHVSTDRPLYRPNQKVQFRAILRKSVAGNYESSEGEKAFVKIVNPLGVVLFEQTLTASEFGTVAGSVQLTDEPPLGEYRVSVRYKDLDFATTFRVEEYRKPEFAVRLDTSRSTYLPGEEVQGSIVAEYLFGAPVVGATVSYQVFEGPFEFDRSRFDEFRWFFQNKEKENRSVEGFRYVAQGTGTTDHNGKLPFRFAPPNGAIGKSYRVVIEATDLSKITVQGGGNVIVSRAGIYVVARTHRKVYRPGDKATISFRTIDASARPVDASGEVVLLRRRAQSSGKAADDVVRETPFETSQGLGETTLTIEEPGEYSVVFRTKDRAGTLCEGGALLRVAGDEPDLRKEARLLAGKAVYRQGEEATLYVNSPVTKRHALLTFEGTNVIDYRVIEISGHSQEIKAKMESAYSPNIHVAIAIPSDNKLYEASDEIIVLQFLNVAVKASKPKVAPGEKVSLEVTTTDQSGRPVEAEISIAVVDQSILELAPDVTPSIKPYFYDQRRQRGVRTGSSYSFRYEGVTATVAAEILDEYVAREDRLESRSQRQNDRNLKLGAATGGGAAASPGGFGGRPSPADKPRSSAASRKGKSAPGRRRGGAKYDNAKKGLEKAKKEADFDDAFGDDDEGLVFKESAELAIDGAIPEASPDLAAPPPPAEAAGGDNASLVTPKIRRRFADTAYWNPTVRTDGKGQAKIEFEVPDNLTSWKVSSSGATKGTLFGEGGTSFRTSKKMLVRLQTPRFLTREDRTKVASPVHNYLDSVQTVRVELEGKGIDVRGFGNTNIKVGAGEARAVHWELAPPPASKDALGAGLLTLEALTGEESDALEQQIPILPFGERHAGGAGGLLVDEALYDYELPENVVPGAYGVQIDIYPHYTDALLDTVLYLRHYPYHCVEQTVSGFLPAIALQKALDRLGTPREDLRANLKRLIPLRIVKILNLQRPSGGWGWWGRESAGSNAEMTALALLALEQCRLAGYRVQADRLKLARSRAASLLSAESNTDRQALLAYALALSNSTSTEALNRLYRYRDRLSGYALSLTTLAQKARGRHAVAAELAELLKTRVRAIDGAPGTPPVPTPRNESGSRRVRPAPLILADRPVGHPSNVETTAYALLALDAIEANSSTARLVAEGLLSLRRGIHWGTTKASAAAVIALSQHFGARAQETDAKIDVLIGGKVIHTIEISPTSKTRGAHRYAIPTDKLVAGENRVALRRRGTADLAYAIRHSHYTAAEKIEPHGNLVRVSRRYETFVPPKPVKYDPIEVSRVDPRRDPRDILVGYSEPTRIAGREASWLGSDHAPGPGYRVLVERHRPRTAPRVVRQIARGEKILVRLQINAREALEYIHVEDPIPAGCEVVNDRDDRFSGSFERKEVRDEKVVFFFTKLAKGTHTITYLLRPTFPGSYRALPTLAQCMYEPAIAGTSSDAPLEILEKLEKVEPEPRDLTWDEKFYEAERAYRRQAGARGRAEDIAALRNRYVEISKIEHLEGRYRDLVLARLVAIDLFLGQHSSAIEGLEELRRRNSRLLAGHGDFTAIAKSYRATKEFEQAIDYQRRLFDLDYLRDRQVGETLFSLGQHLSAQTYGLTLAANYPASSRVIADTFELARRYTNLKIARPIAGSRVKRQREEVLYKDAAENLARFVGYFPTSSLAPQAQFLVINSLENLGEPEFVVTEATKFQKRYPENQYLDDAIFAALKAEFERKNYDEVLKRSSELAGKEFKQANGRKGPSQHYPSAQYLGAKTHHIRGNLDAAVKAYRQIQGKFPDARSALAHLTAKELSAPEVASVPLGQDPKVKFAWKNVDQVKVKLYRVDLALLFAVRKDLRSVSSIDLTGIDPVEELEAKLEGSPYTPNTTEVSIPAKDKGVYLLAARAGEKESSTVLIRSDLKLEVQRVGRSIRVHVLPRGAARIKISDGSRIVANGSSDARGIFEAPVSAGRASVLAERDGHFALYTESSPQGKSRDGI